MIRETHLLSKIAIAGVVLALLVVAIVYAAPAVVDSFDVGEQSLQVTSSSPNDSGYVEDTTIMGGERDTFLSYSSGSGARINLDIDFGGTSNRLAYTAGDTMKGTAELQWDGDDDGASSLNYGLNQDLSGDDGFLLKLLFDDLRGRITIEAHTDSTHWSDMTIDLPGGVDDPQNQMDLFFDHNSFTAKGSGGGVDWSNVNAVVMKIDGTVDAALDVTIDMHESTTAREYGDLPDESYAASILSANHIPKGLRLGNNVDTEASYPTTGDADGDDTTDFDDEDGVTRAGTQWTGGDTGGQVQVVIEGCAAAGGCYVNGWIDWNNDGDFDDTVDNASEHIINNVNETTDGTKTYTIDVPDGGVANGTYYARFRICEGSTDCDNPDNTDTNVNNGEVEDYKWSFGPNAVILSSMTAHSVSANPIAAPLAAIGLVGAGAMGFFALVRRRRDSASQ